MNIERRGIGRVRDFMLPEIKTKSIIVKNNLKDKGDCLMMSPYSKFRKIWSSILIIILIYTATIMPYKLALIDDDNYPMFLIDTIVDFLFITDIIVVFNSPILEKNGQFNYSRKRIMMSYVTSWFFVDLVASLPLNLITKFAI